MVIGMYEYERKMNENEAKDEMQSGITLIKKGLEKIVQSWKTARKKEKEAAEREEALRNERDAALARAEEAEVEKEQYRAEIWNLLLQMESATDFIKSQNRMYGKMLKEEYNDIQLILGNDRAGEDWEEEKDELLHTIKKFIKKRNYEEECGQIYMKEVPHQNMWKPERASEIWKKNLERTIMPQKNDRLLTEKILVALDSSANAAEQINKALEECGIRAVFYEEASEDMKNLNYFGEDRKPRIAYPALVSIDGKEVFSRGLHIK